MNIVLIGCGTIGRTVIEHAIKEKHNITIVDDFLNKNKNIIVEFKILEKNNNNFVVELCYNYAIIEVEVEESEFRYAISRCIAILNSIQYNDLVIEKYIVDNNIENSETVYKIPQPENKSENKNVLEPTFENKLHQSKEETKNYYSILKNELLSYRATAVMGPEYEVFRLYELCVARLSVYCGRVRLRLEFDKKRSIKNLKRVVASLENILVSNGYVELFVDNDDKCNRAIDLIGVLMRDIEVVKDPDYVVVDFAKDYPVIEDGIFSLVEDAEQKHRQNRADAAEGNKTEAVIIFLLVRTD